MLPVFAASPYTHTRKLDIGIKDFLIQFLNKHNFELDYWNKNQVKKSCELDFERRRHDDGDDNDADVMTINYKHWPLVCNKPNRPLTYHQKQKQHPSIIISVSLNLDKQWQREEA